MSESAIKNSDNIVLKYPPREEQLKMVDFTLDAFNAGKKFVLMDAPVGIGKSYYAVMVAQAYRKKFPRAKFDVLTSTKVLQSQYADDFEFINNLWGASNYQCDKFECMCDIGKEFAQLTKNFCAECPYDKAKESFLTGQMSLTNYHLYTLYAMFTPDKLEDRGAEILIVDEAHEFDNIICDFVSLKVNRDILNKMDVDKKTVKKYEELFKNIKTLEEYVNLIKIYLIPDMKAHKGNIMNGEKNKKTFEKLKNIDNYIGKFEIFIAEFEDNVENWIFEIDYNKYTKGPRNGMIDLFAQPIWAGDYLEKYIWSRYKHVILMSGTILDKKLFSFLNGLKEETVAYMYLDSPFAKENRKIFYIPVAKMSYDNKKQAFEKFVPWIRKILNKYPDKKGIIHTVSFELADWVREAFKEEKRLLFHDTSTRDLVLRQHTASKLPSVLVSPSMATGVDLKNDLSRFQIILKIPYPSLGSKKITRRKDVYPPYYAWRTAADISQAYGRSIRNHEDYADTFIIDAGFTNFMKYSGYMLPKYVRDAINNIKI